MPDIFHIRYKYERYILFLVSWHSQSFLVTKKWGAQYNSFCTCRDVYEMNWPCKSRSVGLPGENGKDLTEKVVIIQSFLCTHPLQPLPLPHKCCWAKGIKDVYHSLQSEKVVLELKFKEWDSFPKGRKTRMPFFFLFPPINTWHQRD